MPPVIVENMQCRLSGCRSYPTGSSFLCRRHYNRCACCHRQGQIEERGEHFCFEHVPCQMVGCESTDGPRSVFCADHFETCTTENCCQLVVANFSTEPRCIDHIPCKTTGCNRYGSYLTRENDNLSPFCAVHSCMAPHCSGEAIYSINEGGTQRLLCIEHYAQKCCIEPGCGLLRATPLADLPYCITHLKCAVEHCTSKRGPGSKFCSEHTCQQEGCPRPTPHGAPYCRRHDCRGYLDADKHRHCPMPRSSSAEAVVEYCKLHTCQISELYGLQCFENNENKKYCYTHRCAVCDAARDIDRSLPPERWDLLCRKHRRDRKPSQRQATAGNSRRVSFAAHENH